MSTGLPEKIDPWRAADTRATFGGSLALQRLRRLADLLVDTSGDVVYRLELSRDEERRAIVRGSVRALLQLRCQRCLQAVEHEVDEPLSLALVTDLADARQLPAQYDPLMADEGLIGLQDLIEDELLLGLPQIPAHAPELCAVVLEEPKRGERENPFAVLAEWKRH